MCQNMFFFIFFEGKQGCSTPPFCYESASNSENCLENVATEETEVKVTVQCH